MQVKAMMRATTGSSHHAPGFFSMSKVLTNIMKENIENKEELKPSSASAEDLSDRAYRTLM